MASTSFDSSPVSTPSPANVDFIVSGRYEGEMSTPTAGLDLLDLRIDVDQRYPNSPVMNRISGDFYQLNKITVPGTPPLISRVYRESWIVSSPELTRQSNQVTIVGTVAFWKGIHPPTTLKIVIKNPQPGASTIAAVSFTSSGSQPAMYNCIRKSDAFRELELEVDFCESVNNAPTLPKILTTDHPVRPVGTPKRNLTIEEAYREAGVLVSVSPIHDTIDDSDAQFESWSAAELHDVMETSFSKIGGPWPQWAMWGVLAGAYDNPAVGGLMFDAAAAFGGAGSAPERQGFAVFRKNRWFDALKASPPGTREEAAAARQFLYTWVHEAGHAFNFLHSWNKNRPDALSWMNYDWRYDNLHGVDSYWSNFNFRFDDEELIHLRHGNRASVIMGGDPWASGGHMEAPPGAEHLAAPPGALSTIDGDVPLEFLIRSKPYFEFMEPVSVELRIRNLLPNLTLNLDTRLNPEYGGVVIHIRRPDGRILEYSPVMCKLAEPSYKALSPLTEGAEPGNDRYSEEIGLSYGRYGFYFDEPGEYLVRALYQGAGDLLIPSNIHRLRVGTPVSRDLDITAQDYFSYEVGMNIYLEGSRSQHLKKGFNLMSHMSEKYADSLLGAKLAATVANSLTKPFFSIGDRSKSPEPQALKLTKLHDADPEAALLMTTPAVEVIRNRNDKALNLSYREIVGQRVDCLLALQRTEDARTELNQLHDDLKKTGANPPVLRRIQAFSEQIDTAGTTQRQKLWERVRVQDRKAEELLVKAQADQEHTPKTQTELNEKAKKGHTKRPKKGK
ncbi:MAG TPA: hypothetical protein VJT15_17205 [Pyrinomonadaceae bacterium]|nr:hypothetical protein [Pyrinomonadaceae bacterium]